MHMHARKTENYTGVGSDLLYLVAACIRGSVAQQERVLDGGGFGACALTFISRAATWANSEPLGEYYIPTGIEVLFGCRTPPPLVCDVR
jgi:hypothetical protein